MRGFVIRLAIVLAVVIATTGSVAVYGIVSAPSAYAEPDPNGGH